MEEIIEYVKGCLYDTYGLNVRYNEDVMGRDAAMNKNAEVLDFMKSSPENEKKIVDYIVNWGIKQVQDYQYVVNLENVKKFINTSSAVPLARKIYDKIIMEEEESLTR